MSYLRHNGVIQARRLHRAALQIRIPQLFVAGDAMQALSIAALFVGVTLTTFVLLVSLTDLASPTLGLTVH